MFVHKQLTQVAGAGADQQVLVAVIVEIRPGPAMRVGVRPVAPRQDLRPRFKERAVAHVEVQARLLTVVAREYIRVTVAVQVAPRRAVAFTGVIDAGGGRNIGEGDLCLRAAQDAEGDGQSSQQREGAGDGRRGEWRSGTRGRHVHFHQQNPCPRCFRALVDNRFAGSDPRQFAVRGGISQGFC